MPRATVTAILVSIPAWAAIGTVAWYVLRAVV